MITKIQALSAGVRWTFCLCLIFSASEKQISHHHLKHRKTFLTTPSYVSQCFVIEAMAKTCFVTLIQIRNKSVSLKKSEPKYSKFIRFAEKCQFRVWSELFSQLCIHNVVWLSSVELNPCSNHIKNRTNGVKFRCTSLQRLLLEPGQYRAKVWGLKFTPHRTWMLLANVTVTPLLPNDVSYVQSRNCEGWSSEDHNCFQSHANFPMRHFWWQDGVRGKVRVRKNK